MRELIQELREAIGYYDMEPGTSLSEVRNRWVRSAKMATDRSMPQSFPVDDLWHVREWTWTRDNVRAGYARMNGATVRLEGALKWDALSADLLDNGWDPDEPLYIAVGRNGQMTVEDGNTRLAVCRELGLKEVPVVFSFVPKVDRRKPEGEE